MCGVSIQTLKMNKELIALNISMRFSDVQGPFFLAYNAYRATQMPSKSDCHVA